MSESRFYYRVLDQNSEEVVELIHEELIKGLTFALTTNREEIVRLDCIEKDWVEINQKNNRISITVDDEYFGNSPPIVRLLTSLWANLLDFGPILLEDFYFSESIHKQLVSKLNVIDNRHWSKGGKGPYFGMQIKPSYGLTLIAKTSLASKFAQLGGNFLKEDETYFVDKESIIKESEILQSTVEKHSEYCYYIPNLTPWFNDISLQRKLTLCRVRIGLVAYLIVGIPNIIAQNRTDGMYYWGHRVGYEAIKERLSMLALAKIAAYSGIKFIHIGTPLFSSKESVNRTKSVWSAIKKFPTNPIPVFTKTTPDITNLIVKHFGKNVVLMACGYLRPKGKIDYKRIAEWMEVK